MLDDWLWPDVTPSLRYDGLLLRAPIASDFQQWRQVRLNSRDFLQPFEPRWSEKDLNEKAFKSRRSRSLRLAREGVEFSFFIFPADEKNPPLLGGITLSNIQRRAAQFGNLGYWVAEQSAGKGVMTRAVGGLSRHAFGELELNRLHAACMPHNTASRRVLEKNGFQEEGFAPSYIQINGKWRDHVLYGLTRERHMQIVRGR